MKKVNKVSADSDLYEDNWPLFEKFLGYLRYLQIRKYIKKGSVCADIGCGFNGRFIMSIRKKIKRGYGFDIRANSTVFENIKIVNNSKYNGMLPLKDERLDTVFMLAVIEHLDEDSPILYEAARALKKGGKFVLTTPTPMAKPVLEFLSFKLGLISRESIEEHKHYYTKQELIDQMNKTGCKCVEYKKFQIGFNEMIVCEKQ